MRQCKLSMQVYCRRAKWWQRDGIAAVETESRGKIQFFMADEGRSSIVRSSPWVFALVNCLVLSVYVTTDTSLAAAPVRPVVLNPSQCQVSAELVPDVKTVANRTDSVLTFPRSLNMRHEKA